MRQRQDLRLRGQRYANTMRGDCFLRTDATMPQARPPAMQRAASLVALPALLAELGVDLGRVLAGTGVSPDQLRPDVFIGYGAYLAILDKAAAVSGREDIGLLLGRRQTLAALGPLGRAMRHAVTLGEALADFATLQISNSTGGTVYLLRAGADVLLGYGVYDPLSHASTYLHDLVLAVGCNLIAELTGGAVAPQEIFSCRPAPARLAPYGALGTCPMRFGQNQSCIVLSASSLAFKLPQANAEARRAALADLAAALALAPPGLAERVRHVLRWLLLQGRTTMPQVAAHLGVHPRTLRRELAREATSFAAIKDEVRHAVACELLRLGALPVADIAATLDFASPSAFVHAFGRWAGTSPARWRETALARDA